MTSSSSLARFSPFVLVVAIFTLATLVFTVPLSLEPSSRALDLGPDTRLFLWTIAWDVHALITSPLTVFDANIFYPEQNTLAYSEHQIGSALIGAPILLLTNDPLLAMNFILLISCVASGLGGYALGRQLGLSRASAVFCGLTFCLTPPRFFRLGQLHLATVQWIPLCLALLHRYTSGGRSLNLVGAAALFSLQAWSGGQSGLFLAFAGAVLGAYLLLLGGSRNPLARSTLPGAIAALLLVLAANVPFVLPYLEVRESVGLERSLAEAEEWSPNAASFAASPTHAHRAILRALGQERSVLGSAKAFLFPGLLPIVLAITAVALRNKAVPAETSTHGRERIRPSRLGSSLDSIIAVTFAVAFLLEAMGGFRGEILGVRLSAAGGARAAMAGIVLIAVRYAVERSTDWTFRPLLNRARLWVERRMSIASGFYLVLGALSLWACLGPSFGLYRVLYGMVPGFDFVRVPSRLTLLSVLALAVLAGVGFQNLSQRLRPGLRVWCQAAMFAALLGEMAAFPLDAKPYSLAASEMDDFLRERRRLGELRGDSIAVLPVPDPREDVESARRHSLYMLRSTVHFLPMVNGYSGFTPPRHDALFRRLAQFPSEDAIGALVEHGVSLVVLHKEGYARAEWSAILRRLEQETDRLRLVASFAGGRIYELTRRSPTASGRRE